jgi:hypothetical protein
VRMSVLHRSRTLPHLVAAVLAMALVALVPAVAAAQRCQAPPGTAGIDQYCETIPGAGGNQNPDDAAGGSGGRAGEGLPRRARGALSRAGRDGAGVLRLTGEAPAGKSRKGTPPAGEGVASSQGGSSGTPSGDPLSAVRSAAESGATLSAALPLVLLGLALLALAVGWTRYRGRQSDAA